MSSNNQYHPAEPCLNLLPSIILGDYRLRIVGSRIYYRPPSETFHEFIEYLAYQALGKDWFRKQQSSPHVLWQFANDYNTRKKNGSLIDIRKESDGSISAVPSGPILFWLLFCYDFFVLKHKQVFPDNMIQRLKDQKYFQGARYELAVASIFLRAGFDIEWIDKDRVKNKTCEFVATHRKTGIKVEVEAKSRKKIDSKQGINDLLKDALKKESIYGVPVVIFIDTNLPFTSGVHLEKPIFNDTKRAVGILEDKDKDRLIIITNFPFCYGDCDKVAPPVENIIIFPDMNSVWLDSRMFNDLQNSLNKYSIIPEEI